MDDTIKDCNDYKSKDSDKCFKCINCAGLDDLGNVICCNEIEYLE